MAEAGRREVVGDPLASNPNASSPARALGLSGVGNPNQSGGQVSDGSLVQMLGSVQGVIAKKQAQLVDTEITRGKIAFMSGVTEVGLIQDGNKYTARGYETLNAADKANRFYQTELLNIEAMGQEQDPAEYQKGLMDKRKAMLADLPSDPDVQKVYVAAFEDLAPRLAGAQLQANSAWNKGRQINELSLTLASTGDVSPGTPRVMPGSALAVSPTIVSRPTLYTPRDRDAAIRTMLGEAANQGEVGLAGVAWNMVNRLHAGDYGSNIYDVAHAPLQYSAWNTGEGGNNLVTKYGPGSPQYERAGKVWDAVARGNTVDMTGGSVNYLSKSGMQAMGKDLPKWYKDKVAEGYTEITIGGHTYLGKPGSSSDYKSYGTEVQTLMDSFQGLKGPEKAKALSGAMMLQLDQGNSTLWDSVGGVAGLAASGATPEQIAAVHNSKQRFDAEQDNKFSLATEARKRNLLDDIASGKTLRPDAEAQVQEWYDSGVLNDAEATNVLRQAYAELDTNAYISGPENDPAFQQELVGLYQNMRTDATIDLVGMAATVQQVADTYGVPAKQVDIIIGKMAAIDEQRRAQATSDVEAALAKRADEEGRKGAVKQALASGSGLQAVTGKISIPNADGTTSEVEAKDWGVMYLREQIASELSPQVQAGGLSNEEAAAQLDLRLYTQLAKQGIPDTRFGQAVTAATTGVIIGKDGKPTMEAMQAFDWYQRMTENPQVGAAYVTSMVTDGYTRTLMETAKALDSGQDNPAEALRKAYEFMSNPNVDTSYRVAQDARFKEVMQQKLKTFIDTSKDAGFLGLFGGTFVKEQAAYVDRNNGVASLYLQKQAQANYFRFPQAVPEAHMAKAMQDLERNATFIGGQLVMGGNTSLRDDMGLAGSAKEVPNAAIEALIAERGPAYWGGDYTKRAILSRPNGASGFADYTVNYNSTTKQLDVYLWTDSTHTNIIPEPMSIQVEGIGAWYNDKSRSVGLLEMFGDGVTDTAAGIRRDADKRRTGEVAGDVVGGM